MAALRRPPGEAAPWLQTVQLTLDVFMFIHMFLDAARCLPGVDASVADAIWKRCREVRLPQNLIKVRPKPSGVRDWEHVTMHEIWGLLQTQLVFGWWNGGGMAPTNRQITQATVPSIFP